MGRQEDIIAFSQSEKLKAGVIWVQQITSTAMSLAPDRQDALRPILEQLLGFLGNELMLAKRVSPEQPWHEVEKALNRASVMFSSDPHSVGMEECIYHLSQALSHITNIGQRTMERLFSGA